MGVTLSGNERSFVQANIMVASNLTKLGGAPFLRKLHAIKQGVRSVSSLPIRHPGKEQRRDKGKRSIPFGVILRAGLPSDDSKGNCVSLNLTLNFIPFLK